MGCGIARFGHRDLKPPELEDFVLKVFPLGLRLTVPYDLMGGRTSDLKGHCYGTSRGTAWTVKGGAMGPLGAVP